MLKYSFDIPYQYVMHDKYIASEFRWFEAIAKTAKFIQLILKLKVNDIN